MDAPHLTSPHLTSPHLTSPHLTSHHLTSPQHNSHHPTSSHHHVSRRRAERIPSHLLLPQHLLPDPRVARARDQARRTGAGSYGEVWLIKKSTDLRHTHFTTLIRVCFRSVAVLWSMIYDLCHRSRRALGTAS